MKKRKKESRKTQHSFLSGNVYSLSTESEGLRTLSNHILKPLSIKQHLTLFGYARNYYRLLHSISILYSNVIELHHIAPIHLDNHFPSQRMPSCLARFDFWLVFLNLKVQDTESAWILDIRQRSINITVWKFWTWNLLNGVQLLKSSKHLISSIFS